MICVGVSVSSRYPIGTWRGVPVARRSGSRGGCFGKCLSNVVWVQCTLVGKVFAGADYECMAQLTPSSFALLQPVVVGLISGCGQHWGCVDSTRGVFSDWFVAAACAMLVLRNGEEMVSM